MSISCCSFSFTVRIVRLLSDMHVLNFKFIPKIERGDIGYGKTFMDIGILKEPRNLDTHLAISAFNILMQDILEEKEKNLSFLPWVPRFFMCKPKDYHPLSFHRPSAEQALYNHHPYPLAQTSSVP